MNIYSYVDIVSERNLILIIQPGKNEDKKVHKMQDMIH